MWAIGLRTQGSTLDDVQRAVADGAIVRTWPMRGTLHFVAASDVHWLLDLLAPREIAATARRHRELELDAASFRKAEKALCKALEGGRRLTRDDARTVLERAKLRPEGQRLYHCLAYLAQQKVLCCGPNQGKQQTFVLLSEWVETPARPLDSEAALALLARRYFCGHGPATQHDLMRWAGITAREAKLGISGAADALASEQVGGLSYWFAPDSPPPTAACRGLFLLPGFDEYMLGYKDRSDFLAAEHAGKIVPGNNGIFRPTIVHDGQVIGTWKAKASTRELAAQPEPFEAWRPARAKLFARAAADYARFHGKVLR